MRVKGGLEVGQGQGRLGQQVAGLAGALVSRAGNFQVGREGWSMTGPPPQALVKRLGLVPPEQGSLAEPSSAAYVFNGAYVPLAARLVQVGAAFY